jgi:hypothetical protein
MAGGAVSRESSDELVTTRRWVPMTLSLLAYFLSGLGLTIYNKWLLSKSKLLQFDVIIPLNVKTCTPI